MPRTRKQPAAGAAAAESDPPAASTPRGRKRAAAALPAVSDDTTPPAKRARGKAPKYAESDESDDDEDVKHEDDAAKEEAKANKKTNGSSPKKPIAKASAKAAPKAKAPRPPNQAKASTAAAMPLAARTAHTAHRIGAHVSAAGGVHNAVANAVQLGSHAFALFLKSQRKWANPALSGEHAAAFADACTMHAYDAPAHVVPHGSYLVNLASADAAKAEQAYTSFLDDLQRCTRLGIGLYNFHPGNTNGEPRDAAIARLASQLNRAHAATAEPVRGGAAPVVTLLENMAAAPEANTLGGRFEDLAGVIARVADKRRVGVCLDTCHLFAAGFDLRAPGAFAATMDTFDRVVGLKYLRAWHVNDSKGVLGSHRDLHQNIGLGFLGLRAFHNLVNDARFAGMPMILETPIDRVDGKGKSVEDKGVWAREIKLLESLVGMDAEGHEFKTLEADLAAQGSAERQKLQEQFDRKAGGAKSKAAGGQAKGKGGTRGRKKKQDESAEDNSDEDD